MAENSLIKWTDNTQNFWKGCTKVSPECTHCYIGPILKRSGMAKPFGGPIRCTSTWGNPAKWNRQAQAARTPLRVFCSSMTDFFHEGADKWRPDAWDIIRDCTWLDWQILTKRPELIAERLPDDWGDGWPHVWLGVTCGINETMWRVDALLEIPAALRFVSAEPLLERVNFGRRLRRIDWLISGCEQCGVNKRRPTDPEWIRDIDRQCQRFDVAHFFKQYYDGTTIKFDGLLDGKIQQDMPFRLPTVPGRTMTSVEKALRKRPMPKKRSTSRRDLLLSDLLAAKNFISETGGIERARSAIDLIGRIQSS